MKQAIRDSLDNLLKISQDLSKKLSDPEITKDIDKLTKLNKEFSEISPIVTKYEEYIQLDETLKEARELLSSDDKDMVELAEEEIAAAASKPELIEQDLKLMLCLPVST